MIKTFKYMPFIAAVIFISSCKKAFVPAVISTDNNYLVVEGIINTGNDSTKIKLSHTVKLTDTTKVYPELAARAYIEDDKNNKFYLREFAGGVYKCSPLNFQKGQKCRLHIFTDKLKEYVSDYVEAAVTPPVDSINFSVLTSGIQFYVSTHDPSNETKYYRWDFDETWEYVSLYSTNLKYVNDQILFRTADEDIHRCWTEDHSYQILLSNTTYLSQSVVNKQPLLYVDRISGKLARGYSMLLHQYALSKEAYQYWQQLKKNTEQIGTIFDAQPSELRGNLHNINDVNEPVIGYISASNVTTKRVLFDPFFLNIKQFNDDYYPRPYLDECEAAFLSIEPAESFEARAHKVLASGDSLLVEVVERKPDGKLIGYNYAQNNCVDCRLKFKNGTNNRPSYWPPYL